MPKPGELGKSFTSDPLIWGEIDDLKNTYQTMFFAREGIIARAKAAEGSNNLEEYQQAIKMLMKHDKGLKDSLAEMEKLMQKQFYDEAEDYIEMPEYGPEDKIDMTQIKVLPTFDPTNQKVTLYELWQKIKLYVEIQGLSEAATKTILAHKLNGEAFDIYTRNMDHRVKDIIQQLNDRYGSFKTKEDYEDEMIQFQRSEEETIKAAMNRFEHILRNYYKGHKDLKKILEQMCKEKVRKIAQPQAREQLDRRELEQRQGGYELTYSDRLKIIHMEEKILRNIGRIPNLADI